MTLLERSLTGSVLILLVTAVRALGLNRLPKGAFPALWAVALLRLLLPVRLASPASAYNLIPGAAGASGMAGAHQEAAQAAVSAAAGSGTPAASGWMPLWAVYFAVLAALALYFLVGHLRCRRRYAQALPVNSRAVMDILARRPLRRRVWVGVSDRIDAPLTFGLLRPVILLPRGLEGMEERALSCILEHELTHVRRLDALYKYLMAAALCAHWFNPLVWLLFALAGRDLELACDAAVIRRSGPGMKRTYALLLIELEAGRSAAAALGNSFSMNAIEERIGAIMKLKRVSALAVLLAVALVLGTAVAFATSPVGVERSHSGAAGQELAGALDGQAAPEGVEEAGGARDPEAQRALFAAYQPYGLTVDGQGALWYQGERVRGFDDTYWDLFGLRTVSLSNWDEAGSVDVEAVREGGALTGLRRQQP